MKLKKITTRYNGISNTCYLDKNNIKNGFVINYYSDCCIMNCGNVVSRRYEGIWKVYNKDKTPNFFDTNKANLNGVKILFNYKR